MERNFIGVYFPFGVEGHVGGYGVVFIDCICQLFVIIPSLERMLVSCWRWKVRYLFAIRHAN
mgnify:CR=1 FL=1